MRLVKREEGRFIFHLPKREKRWLNQLVGMYPLIQSGHHVISKGSGAGSAENQQLLEEALAAQRLANRRQVQALITDPHRLRETETGYNLTLDGPQVEALLQVLNDVRVGGWLQVGSPDAKRNRPVRLTERTAPYLWAMEVSGFFESCLLDALNS